MLPAVTALPPAHETCDSVDSVTVTAWSLPESVTTLLSHACIQALEETSDKVHKEFNEPSQMADKHDTYIRHEKQASRLKMLIWVISIILLLGLGLGLGLGFGHDRGSNEVVQNSGADQLLLNTTGELASATSAKAATTTGAIG